MPGLETYPARPLVSPEDQAVLHYRRRTVCVELYALGVLIGVGLSIVYVIGSLILRCMAG